MGRSAGTSERELPMRFEISCEFWRRGGAEADDTTGMCCTPSPPLASVVMDIAVADDVCAFVQRRGKRAPARSDPDPNTIGNGNRTNGWRRRGHAATCLAWMSEAATVRERLRLGPLLQEVLRDGRRGTRRRVRPHVGNTPREGPWRTGRKRRRGGSGSELPLPLSP